MQMYQGEGQSYQGDIRGRYVDAIPADAVPVKPTNGWHIIALGESTGHCHAIAEQYGELFETPDGTLWFSVYEIADAPMRHGKLGSDMGEHDAIGYQRGRVVEFSPQCQQFAGDVQRVRD